MTRPPISVLLSALPLAAAPAAAPPAIASQAVVQPLGFGDADRLAAAMRRLAANASDLPTLIEAGELSLRLGDLSAAASLLARADRVDPRNGRVKAGMAAILVRAERPGEALRYFQLAEGFGLAPAAFAADRGLAFDLIGAQERAQRDYRLALKTRADPETVRRYALSLGISGQRDRALAQLAPLLQQVDRGAWRARAFVLAMAGDTAEASHIAVTMMPPGMATGLQPFFQRLASLPPVDRAFAVHFGEVRTTPERAVDARLTPVFAALGPDPDAPRVAAAAVPSSPPEGGRTKSRPRDARADRAQVARRPEPSRPVGREPVRRPLPAAVAQAGTSKPATPAVAVAARDEARALIPQQPAMSATLAAVLPSTPLAAAPTGTRLALLAPVPALVPAITSIAPALTLPTATVAPTSPIVVVPTSPVVEIASSRVVVPPAPPPAAAPIALGAEVMRSALPAIPIGTQPSTDAQAPILAVPQPIAASALATPVSLPASGGSAVPSTSAPPVLAASPPLPAAPSTPLATADVASASSAAAPPSVAREAAAVVPVTPASTTPPPAITTVELPPSAAFGGAVPPPPVRGGDDLILARIVANLSIPASELGVAPPRRVAEAPAAAKPPVGKKLIPEKKVADKAAADEEKTAARANPERIWVQVAGGASADDLPRAWAAAKAKAPEAFARRTGYTTPLRATNRVLAGPFKTDAEARGFVNELSRKGVSAFTFTSDKGQPVSKLPGE